MAFIVLTDIHGDENVSFADFTRQWFEPFGSDGMGFFFEPGEPISSHLARMRILTYFADSGGSVVQRLQPRFVFPGSVPRVT